MLDFEMLDRKYARLLLLRCLSFNNTDTLLIDYKTHEQDGFVGIVKEEAKKIGVKNILVSLYDEDELHEYLVNTKLEDIKLNPLIDRTIWDEVAKIGGCILHIDTFIPNLMNDVHSDKISKAFAIRLQTYKSNYKANNSINGFPWVICAYPNKRWANYLFNNDSNAFFKLHRYIMEMCMVDKENPIYEWEEFIKKSNYYKDILQELQIKSLHYTNGLGTNIEVGLIDNSLWLNSDKKDKKGSPIMVNMPSYEIFTSPNCRKVNGIVYSSKPLVLDGSIIDKFFIRFKDGIAVEYHAEIGNDLLKNIIEQNKNANMLGEIALVNYDSPISSTGIIFYDTLFDENASCHFALGEGFSKTINNGDKLSEDDLQKLGINISPVHFDFMIGTHDMTIEAETPKGKVLVFKNGNFII